MVKNRVIDKLRKYDSSFVRQNKTMNMMSNHLLLRHKQYYAEDKEFPF